MHVSETRSRRDYLGLRVQREVDRLVTYMKRIPVLQILDFPLIIHDDRKRLTWAVCRRRFESARDNIWSRTMGTRTMGTRTMGTRTMGTRTLGTRTMGTRTMGTRTMGARRNRLDNNTILD